MTAPHDSERVLAFWFGELDALGRSTTEQVQRWYRRDDEFDARIREQFLEDLHAIVGGEREEWLATPRGRLAYVIVLDQFSRNLFRKSPQAFASDPQARRAAEDGLARGDD